MYQREIASDAWLVGCHPSSGPGILAFHFSVRSLSCLKGCVSVSVFGLRALLLPVTALAILGSSDSQMLDEAAMECAIP